MDKRKLVVICGPTATGKSALAVALAQKFGGEVVSADSMQVYRGMDIGTAKPDAAERGGIPHAMIDCAEIGEPYGAAVYREQAKACIDNAGDKGKLPILCGGTGLYINATVYPLDFSKAGADPTYRKELTEYAEKNGNEALHRLLAEASPDAAAAIHANNVKRVIRALERLKAAEGGAFEGDSQLFNGEPLYELAWIGLTMDREMLYRRIDARVDDMMRRGLMDEVARLAVKYGRDAVAFQALGYKELLDVIDGKVTPEDAVCQIKQGTRNYSKRQLTWFKRETRIRWFDVGTFGSFDALAEATAGYIRETLHITV